MVSLLGLHLPPVSTKSAALLGLGLVAGAVGEFGSAKYMMRLEVRSSSPLIVRTPAGDAESFEVFAVESLGSPTSFGTITRLPQAGSGHLYVLRCSRCRAYSEPCRSVLAEEGELLDVSNSRSWHQSGCPRG